MSASQEKLFAGARLRRLRKELGQTQAQFAESLNVSPSYLNLLERNQRPVTARVLLSLAEVFDVDVRAFAAESDRQLLADLKEAAADPVLKSADLDARDVQELADAHPRAAEALAKLHQAYRESNAAAADLALRATGEEGGAILSPLEEVRDALDAASNYFPSIEDACDRFRAGLDDPSDLGAALTARLKSSHGAAVRTYDDAVMGGALRRFDFHARKLLLSDLLEPAGRVFHLAVTLVNLELGDVLDQEAHRASGLSDDARAMLRSTLASYAAAALMMPYQTFFEAAERSKYDIDALRRKFEVSFEQVCHRLTTLHRPGARGVPFFMIRTDQAGNVTKRFGGGVLAFARSGGGCARWRLYDVFRAPEQLHVQGLELTDGSRFISISRAVTRPLADGTAALNAVAVGCEVSALDRIVYDPGERFTPIGLSCRLCDRNDCPVRAFPPMQRSLRVDPHLRGAAPFSFGDD
ncbi:short-chain fatty acyl-CoA regulator family protein [Oceanicaulis sp. LC35]|uniref:helix-turn-helix domain-containing protein n=1 Tax=Oceanicaulis sp. LC35 TaxID=3349635 RepID=UPI003F869681